jgi:hypothetical protein
MLFFIEGLAANGSETMAGVRHLRGRAQTGGDAEVGVLGRLRETFQLRRAIQHLQLAYLGEGGLVGLEDDGGGVGLLRGVGGSEGQVVQLVRRCLERTLLAISGQVLEYALHLGHFLSVEVGLVLEGGQQGDGTLHNIADSGRFAVLVLVPELPAHELREFGQLMPVLLPLALDLQQSGQRLRQRGLRMPLVLLLAAETAAQLVATPHALGLQTQRGYDLPAVRLPTSAAIHLLYQGQDRKYKLHDMRDHSADSDSGFFSSDTVSLTN